MFYTTFFLYVKIFYAKWLCLTELYMIYRCIWSATLSHKYQSHCTCDCSHSLQIHWITTCFAPSWFMRIYIHQWPFIFPSRFNMFQQSCMAKYKVHSCLVWMMLKGDGLDYLITIMSIKDSLTVKGNVRDLWSMHWTLKMLGWVVEFGRCMDGKEGSNWPFRWYIKPKGRQVRGTWPFTHTLNV